MPVPSYIDFLFVLGLVAATYAIAQALCVLAALFYLALSAVVDWFRR